MNRNESETQADLSPVRHQSHGATSKPCTPIEKQPPLLRGTIVENPLRQEENGRQARGRVRAPLQKSGDAGVAPELPTLARDLNSPPRNKKRGPKAPGKGKRPA